MTWLRKDRLDDDVLAQLRLQPGERVLAFGVDPDGRAVVGTDRGLLLQRTPPQYSRVLWHEIDRASFADDLLTVQLPVEPGGDPSRLRIRLAVTGRLPEVVRDRVTASVVLDQHVPLRGREGVRVVARRRPDGDVLQWGFVVDEGLVLTADEMASAQVAVGEIRAEYG